MSDDPEKFWSKVNKTSTCWLWSGCVSSNGYGSFRWNGKTVTTHRLSFFLSNGYMPSSNMDIIHSCDVKICVNPNHLRVGTRKENILDYLKKGFSYGKTGENNHMAKITDLQYKEIKTRIENGEQKTSVCLEYGITRQSYNGRVRRERK